MATLTDDLAGLLLGERYRIVRLLGRGGMGAVFVARDERLGVDVAVKVVREALLDDATALERFKREARLLPELVHEHIVRSYGAGEDQGLLWIAMELLEGTTLRARIEERGRMTWRESLPIVRQVAGALAAAHDKGVIHRDLKPDNVMFVGKSEPGATPDIRLLDFGVAKGVVRDGSAASMTGTGMMIGTPGYIAPEVIVDGKNDEPRSDLYALGVLWFELVTGARPFTAKTPVALAMAHAHHPAPSPSSMMPFHPLPAPVDRLILRLLSKQPEDRPASARDLIALLDRIEGEATLAEQEPTAAAFAQASFPTVTDVSRTPTFTPGPMPAANPEATARMATPATAAVAPTRLERIPSGVSPAPLSAPPTSGVHMTPKAIAALAASIVAAAVVVTIGVIRFTSLDERSGAQPPSILPTAAPGPSANETMRTAAPQPPILMSSADEATATPNKSPTPNPEVKVPAQPTPREPRTHGTRPVGTAVATALPPAAPAVLTLVVEPKGVISFIVLDGREHELPVVDRGVPPGPHTVSLKTEGGIVSHELTLEPGDDKTFRFDAITGARK